MQQAATLRTLLEQKLGELLSSEPRPAQADIDLAGISDLDACGCQLLALFLENVRSLAVTPLPCRLAPRLAEKINLLGFRPALGPSTDESEEAL